MSAAAESESEDMLMQCCACCGIAGVDDIKLKDCDGCDRVKYCSDTCQKDHRPQHEEECKKRAAELYDEILFKQPESSHLGDCPICCVPLPIGVKNTLLMSCCSKMLCKGCCHASQVREIERRLEQKCPFCRKAFAETNDERNKQRMKRIEVNDPAAMCFMGMVRCQEGDYKSAFEYFTNAASLGDVDAHYQLSCLYVEGKGIEKDEKKQLHHLRQAVIGGHFAARHNLGCVEVENGQHNRAAKHFIIAAKLGYDKSLECVKELFKAGHVSKEDFTAALRGYQTVIEATKSPQRREAEKYAEWLAECKRRGV